MENMNVLNLLNNIKKKEFMNNEELKFKRHVHFQGRNGWFQSIGLAIFQVQNEDVINIQPITTKEKVGNCMIEIPIEEIDNLIEILNKIKDGITL